MEVVQLIVRIALLVTLSIFASGAAAMDGNTLRTYCRSDIPSAADYVMGFIDKHNHDQMVIEGILKPNIKNQENYELAKSMIGNFCFPKDVSNAKGIAVVCNWAKTDTDKEITATGLIIRAFENTWPCK